MNFIIEHKDIWLLILGAVIGVILPKAKTNLLGRKIGEKIPKKDSNNDCRSNRFV